MTKTLKYILNSLHSEPKSISSGFTIVELLVVIVVIAILAAITIVSYTGITSKAIASALQSDLDNASKQLKLYYNDHGVYPVSLDASNCPLDSNSTVDTRYCLKSSNGNTFTYAAGGSSSSNPISFGLKSTNSNGTSYIINNNSSPSLISSNPTLTCPTGFIPVPGSLTYGTGDFCVMKYEAKNDGSNNAISVAAGTPWVSISQINAIPTSIAACTGCHLITEAEWLTVAQNVLSVTSNWSTGTVGSGYIYSGHNDGAPNNSVAASTDNDPYSGTGQTTGTQRRTLTLTNGEVIWDLAGNVNEWTTGTTAGGQPGIIGETALAWKEWTAVTASGTLSPNPSPAATGISGSSGWTSGKGIGVLYSNAGETVLRNYMRSGSWNYGTLAGVLTLTLHNSPGNAGTGVGFRAAK